jgi:AcrR family transcriptional regulator
MNELEADKGSKRERTKARNRSVFLQAAREVFVEIGYDAASVRDIVARTDLAPGTFYNYFPDKQSVLLALVGEASSVGTRRIREARSRAKTLEERVYVGFRAYFDFIAGDRTLFELMRRNFATLRGLGLDETGFADGLADLEAELREAVRVGTVPALPIPYMTRAIGAITFELGAEMATHDPPDIEGATNVAVDLLLGAIERLRRKGRSSASLASHTASHKTHVQPRSASGARGRPTRPEPKKTRDTTRSSSRKQRST